MVQAPPRRMPAEGSTVTFDAVPLVERPEDLFALALAIEQEAARRYGALAAAMAEDGEDGLAALFRRLAAAEAEHATGVGAWAGRKGIVPSRSLSFRWDNPESAAGDDIGQASRTTPYQALAMAVRNEERAFAFYAQVAAKTSSADVRAYAERMAREELEHVATLRQERRQAYHRQRDKVAAALPAAGPPRASDSAGLQAYVRAVEQEAAARLRAKAATARLATAMDLARLFQDLADEAEARARTMGAAGPPPPVAPPVDTPRALIEDEERRLARLYDAWMQLVEGTRSETVLRGSQEEVFVVLGRLSRLRDFRARADATAKASGSA